MRRRKLRPRRRHASKDSVKCQSYGLQPGTTEYEKCLAQLADKRAQAEANERSSLGNRLQGRPPTWAQRSLIRGKPQLKRPTVVACHLRE